MTKRGERKYTLIPGWNEPRTFWNNPEIKIPENAKEQAVKEYIVTNKIAEYSGEGEISELTDYDINTALLLYQIRWLRAFNVEMQRKTSPRMKKAGRICRDWADALEMGMKKERH